MIMSINLECQNNYLPTSATNWNFYSLAKTVKLEKINIKARNREKSLSLILKKYSKYV